MSQSESNSLPSIAVDTGGTFTDAIGRWGERIATAKQPSTPQDPSLAVRSVVRDVLRQLGASEAAVLVHGTTVATNALLEQTGAETWLVTNTGFGDLLRIGRQARADLYALEPRNPPPLVTGSIEVPGRMLADGTILEPVDLDSLRAALEALDERPLSFAVCLLHSYHDPQQEEAVADTIRECRPTDSLSLSSRILPVFREVERASTTAANASVQPLMVDYLGRLRDVAKHVRVMGSAGGQLTLEQARERPVLTALSGPAGGVVAALEVAAAEGGVISFDMGGTSTDVAVCRGELPVRHSSRVGAYAIHVPMLDIHTVGAGGGSLARVDAGGALRVGPESAGANPGPACYGRGLRATVTDANVVLGRLPADTKLGGELALEPARALRAVEEVATALGVTVDRAAHGIIEIAVQTMARAVRKISVERGLDPRDYSLCAFGGAGGLHACDLAEALGMTRVLVPAHAGVLSAVGMLQGRAAATRSRTVLNAAQTMPSVRATLLGAAKDALGGPGSDSTCEVSARYSGQSFELLVPYDGEWSTSSEQFQAAHEARFGYRLPTAVEPVTLHVRAEGPRPSPWSPREAATAARLVGPTTVVRMACAVFVATGWAGEVRPDGSIVLERA
ncbi:MAG: N-methylhydantoinase A [Bradymonadia bacterium]